MNFNYKTLSAGYIGLHHENSTLNSQFYTKLFHNIKNTPDFLNTKIYFPQRIPRSGFFKELYDLESDDYKVQFNQITHFIKQHHLSSINELVTNNSKLNAIQYINWSNILLRFGCFEHLINHFPENFCGDYPLEIALIKETAKIEIYLSTDREISIHELLELADIYLNNTQIVIHEKIKLLNQIVVYFNRYQKEPSLTEKVSELSKILLSLINELDMSVFENMLCASVAYRGLAMENQFGTDLQFEFLNRAEQFAKTIKPQSEFENIVAAENLYTCSQTISKWYMSRDLKSAENYLQQLISLDPYDSTGFSELGFFYINSDSYEMAAKYFLKAIDLGPPGTGMNTYYYAKCLEKLGNLKDAIVYLQKSTLLDNEAISPWLDLLVIFNKQNQASETKKIATHIFNTNYLFDQLEDDEKILIQHHTE